MSARSLILAVLLGLLPLQAQATKRAFVVGIAHYADSHMALPNGVRDADVVTSQLEKFHFQVSRVKDADSDKDKLRAKWKTFKSSIKKHDDVVVYISGHGLAVEGANYFVPRDVTPSMVTAGSDPRTLFLPLAEMIA